MGTNEKLDDIRKPDYILCLFFFLCFHIRGLGIHGIAPFGEWLAFIVWSAGPSVLCTFLLVCGDRDSAVRVQHHLAAAEYGHQQEETEQEEEEEGKTKVHIYVEPAWGGG